MGGEGGLWGVKRVYGGVKGVYGGGEEGYGGGEGGLWGGGDVCWKLFFCSFMLYITVSPFLLSCLTLLFLHCFIFLWLINWCVFAYAQFSSLSFFVCLFIVVLLYYLTLNVDCGVR